MRVDFYFSINSRYAYLAATQLDALVEETGAAIAWRPLYLARLMQELGRDPFDGPPLSGQYVWDYREQDAEDWAAYYGVPFHEPRQKSFDAERAAMACVAAERLGAAAPFARALFRRISGSDEATIDDESFAAAAVEAGLDGAGLLRLIEEPATERFHEARIAEAAGRGVFGVPTFCIGPKLFWGNDRLPLLRHYLTTRAGHR